MAAARANGSNTLRLLVRLARYGKESEGRWVTLSAKDKGGDEHGHARVFIGKGGKIEKGPAALEGKAIGDVDKNKDSGAKAKMPGAGPKPFSRLKSIDKAGDAAWGKDGPPWRSKPRGEPASKGPESKAPVKTKPRDEAYEKRRASRERAAQKKLDAERAAQRERSLARRQAKPAPAPAAKPPSRAQKLLATLKELKASKAKAPQRPPPTGKRVKRPAASPPDYIGGFKRSVVERRRREVDMAPLQKAARFFQRRRMARGLPFSAVGAVDYKGNYDESKHPRAADGKFTSGTGESKGASDERAPGASPESNRGKKVGGDRLGQIVSRVKENDERIKGILESRRARAARRDGADGPVRDGSKPGLLAGPSGVDSSPTPKQSKPETSPRPMSQDDALRAIGKKLGKGGARRLAERFNKDPSAAAEFAKGFLEGLQGKMGKLGGEKSIANSIGDSKARVKKKKSAADKGASADKDGPARRPAADDARVSAKPKEKPDGRARPRGFRGREDPKMPGIMRGLARLTGVSDEQKRRVDAGLNKRIGRLLKQVSAARLAGRGQRDSDLIAVKRAAIERLRNEKRMNFNARGAYAAIRAGIAEESAA